jgi:hypothetical protein
MRCGFGREEGSVAFAGRSAPGAQNTPFPRDGERLSACSGGVEVRLLETLHESARQILEGIARRQMDDNASGRQVDSCPDLE